MPSASTHSVIHTDSPLSEMSGTRSSEGSGSCGRGAGRLRAAVLFHKGPQQCRLSHFAEPWIRAGVQQGNVYWGRLSPAQQPIPVWPPLTLPKPWRLGPPGYTCGPCSLGSARSYPFVVCDCGRGVTWPRSQSWSVAKLEPRPPQPGSLSHSIQGPCL